MTKSNITEIINKYITTGIKKRLIHSGKSKIIIIPSKILKALQTKQGKTWETLEYITLKVSPENKIIIEE